MEKFLWQIRAEIEAFRGELQAVKQIVTETRMILEPINEIMDALEGEDELLSVEMQETVYKNGKLKD